MASATAPAATNGTAAARPRVRCRPIAPTDLDPVAGLLAAGFPARTRQRWRELLGRLERNTPPEGLPQFGYLLENEGAPIGVLLLICSAGENGGVRCNPSSWYVDPAFRTYAPLLTMQANRFKTATYLNISAADEVRPIIEAQGFHRFAEGTFAAVPALTRTSASARIAAFTETAAWEGRMAPWAEGLLRDHGRFGCLTLCCETADTIAPIVLRHRRIVFHSIRPWVPCAQLIFCPAVEELPRYAGPLGRFLALRGMPFVLINADGPINGLTGKYFAGRTPMYYRGPEKPRLGDLAYTEAALFGY